MTCHIAFAAFCFSQNDSICTLLARLEGIIGPMPSWMISQGRYGTRYYTRSRQLYERSRHTGRCVDGAYYWARIVGSVEL
jgi:hypothetical protein